MKRSRLVQLLSCLLVVSACSNDSDRFALLPASETGINFRNSLEPDADFNILNYMYYYNGAGVAVGDFNGDGMTDIYLAANQESNKLFLNRGEMKFENVTDEAGVAGFNGWTTGVTTADVNGDGKLDIYVGYLGGYSVYQGKNQLFINQGNDDRGVPKFVDRAMDYSLDFSGFTTQSAFFDYDRDGDLDVFLLTHSLHDQGTFGTSALRKQKHPLAGDRLLRNEGTRFVDVTEEAGIYSSVIGYGLGLAVSDVNMDGWPDVYVGNDFHENDYLYINQHDGTFAEVGQVAMRHTSRFSMGVDVADINNDAFPDLFVSDMLPYDPQILKASAAEDPYDIYAFKLAYGYHHQFARNTLQINNRDGSFSDIALQAGVSSTDWSWATLFADFDLDGYKDVFVANGIPRRPNDLDYVNFVSTDSISVRLEGTLTQADLAIVERMPVIRLPNFLFRNNGDSTFTDKSSDWGLGAPSFSNGAAYADFDNDGDLDLIVNNINDEPFLYENKIRSKGTQGPPYLKIQLKGNSPNSCGIGAKVFVYSGGNVQMQECIPTRGFLSAVDYPLIFGLPAGVADSLVVVWNSGKSQVVAGIGANVEVSLYEKDAVDDFNYNTFASGKPLFVNSTNGLMLPYRHTENSYVEFAREQLLPHMISAEGPAVAVGDVNGDGKEDIFLGGGKRQESSVLLQNANGQFERTAQADICRDSVYEDVDAILFDADNDSDLDLFVVSGGNEFFGKSVYLHPRLYLNDGHGTFSRKELNLDYRFTGACARAGDIDSDGDLDIFFGSRAVPQKYGVLPDSYVLLNDGHGNFSDETDRIAPALRRFALVTDAAWVDIDGDRDLDLVVAAEWSHIQVFLNEDGHLEPLELQGSGLEFSSGWWNCVYPIDYDRDGDVDLIAGNLGLNSKLKASDEEPVRLFVEDFDDNGSIDQVLTHYVFGRDVLFHTRDEIVKQLPSIKKKYLSYRQFSEATLTDLFTEEKLRTAEKRIVHRFESSIIENLGNRRFRVKPLPSAAQISVVGAIISEDINADGRQDLIMAGNFYPVNIQRGRYDASYGLVLINDGKTPFTPMPQSTSGLRIEGEVRAIRKIIIDGRSHFLAVRNNNTIEAFCLSD